MSKEVLAKNIQKQFNEVLAMVEKARSEAMSRVNSVLVELYWEVGKYVSKKLESAEWGDEVVPKLADFIKQKRLDIKGFDKRELYRMRQFYEAYKNDEFVGELRPQITWTNHRLILTRKTPKERQFYMLLAAKEKYTEKQLKRQIETLYFERVMNSEAKFSPVAKKQYPDIEKSFRDTYSLEFLGLPEKHTEKNLRKAIIKHIKDFILEFGRDFSFMGQEYKVDVGMENFYVDLLFFHRGLRCLVAFELKVEKFKPAHLGQMSFYLGALDQQVKREDENPSVGIILCKEKNDEVVKLALSQTMSSTLVADYETQLNVKSLQQKFKEIVMLSESNDED
jgi:predicted nuclease of restriction endonuclease-like (RecB) superfamily